MSADFKILFEELRDQFIDLQVMYARAFRNLMRLARRQYPGLLRVKEVDGRAVINMTSCELFSMLEGMDEMLEGIEGQGGVCEGCGSTKVDEPANEVQAIVNPALGGVKAKGIPNIMEWVKTNLTTAAASQAALEKKALERNQAMQDSQVWQQETTMSEKTPKEKMIEAVRAMSKFAYADNSTMTSAYMNQFNEALKEMGVV